MFFILDQHAQHIGAPVLAPQTKQMLRDEVSIFDAYLCHGSPYQ